MIIDIDLPLDLTEKQQDAIDVLFEEIAMEEISDFDEVFERVTEILYCS